MKNMHFGTPVGVNPWIVFHIATCGGINRPIDRVDVRKAAAGRTDISGECWRKEADVVGRGGGTRRTDADRGASPKAGARAGTGIAGKLLIVLPRKRSWADSGAAAGNPRRE